MTGTAARSAPSGPGGATAAEPTQEELFDLLGNARRRRVLRHLLEEPSITLTDLSARIAATENDVAVSEVTSRQRKQVYSSLYQTHIPRLSDHGLVAYDADDRVVDLTGDRQHLGRVLDMNESRRSRLSTKWSRYYLWTATVGSALIAGHWLGTMPASGLTTEAIYGLLTVAFMMLSVSFVMAVKGPKLVRLVRS